MSRHWTSPTNDAGLPDSYRGLQQLVAAALAKPDLAAVLLHNPAGVAPHIPQDIHLSQQEHELLQQASPVHDLASFAAQLDQLIRARQQDPPYDREVGSRIE